MNSNQIRKAFTDFFETKQHKIVPSAPMVVKNDPTLMFTNAGMNQFKDIFLGNSPIKYPRIANSQKCLRVSGKHNDLEEVGHDTYHHTMFEMLGNWSFGDYFKKEAIEWAWEFLTEVLKIDKNRLYATVFEGSKEEGLEPDNEAKEFWKKYMPEDRIIYGSKKDNFWEMGESGPCGPCSEIHVDIRSEEERQKVNALTLVNQSHPHVIEIWNNVFIQYNRKADGSLEQLPAKHVDTGMGFERLCMVVQGKQSSYDTDVFQLIIQEIGKMSGKKYGETKQTDIAMRVIADHLRTVSFAIADGQLPSNNKAGYVIRRILRRAVRYGYTFLNFNEPFINKLLTVLIESMGAAYPELQAQRQIIEKVIHEEEASFLRTLETGIKLLDQIIGKTKAENKDIVNGKDVFELYDTYGFPFDLTDLILRENGLTVNKNEFDQEMLVQKNRSRDASSQETQDWVVLMEDDVEEFIGYDFTDASVQITKYRKVATKGKEHYQLVFHLTPFYAESGGQVGDKGYIQSDTERIEIVDTKKENNLIVHIVENLPNKLKSRFKAEVYKDKRRLTECNHSATHLLHLALRKVLGTHVEQKGSLVEPDRLRFDFSHFQKMSDEEIQKVEEAVNELIRQNNPLKENRAVPIEQAQKLGAMMLFGEKYGDVVRVIQYGDSIELCGGTHVKATGEIGLFKIVSESAIAAGIRRIEAITSSNSEQYINEQINTLKEIREFFKNPKDILKSLNSLNEENALLKKQIEVFAKEKVGALKDKLSQKVKIVNGINLIAEKVEIDSAASLKDLCFQMKDVVKNLVLVIGAELNGKANLSVMISENLVKEKNMNANTIIRELSKEIQGGGGGQAFYATAGGSKIDGIDKAISKVAQIIG